MYFITSLFLVLFLPSPALLPVLTASGKASTAVAAFTTSAGTSELETSGSAPFLLTSLVPHFCDLAKTLITMQLPYTLKNPAA